MGGPIYCIKKIYGKSKKLVKKNENAKEVFWHDEYCNSREIVILATRHVEYVAEAIKVKLRKVGIKASIIYSMPEGGYSKRLHIVICPQMFQKLPRLYFAYQLEQRDSKWFTEEYFEKLRNAVAVFDYTIENIKYLFKNGFDYKQVYYLPIQSHEVELVKEEHQYDVLFYGDPDSDRRKKFLEAIAGKFNLKVCVNVFGQDLIEEIKKAKVVVNIHFYEDALLETTRISQLLSMGKLIVSERGINSEEQQEFEDLVSFVDVGDVDGMLKAIQDILETGDIEDRREKLLENVQNKTDWSEFYLYRALLAFDLITFDQFYYSIGKQINIPETVCLSLTETIERREHFKRSYADIPVFQGLRHDLGWVGAGLSYKFLINRAKDEGLPQLTVCEDDVELLPGHNEKLEFIRSYLKRVKEWDIFSGLIADFDKDTKVLSVEKTEIGYLATIDRTVSNVFCIYNKNIYDRILMWNHMYRNVQINTIDRFIQNLEKMRVVCCYPYFVKQSNDVSSTLWGIDNTKYSKMIDDSEKAFYLKIQEKLNKGDAIN